MKTTNYKDRVNVHDNLALPAVDCLFGLMGYSHFQIGVEREEKRFRDALKNRNDPHALKIRFSPDRFYSKNDQNVVICEVKSEYKQNPHFSIEFDSYMQALEYGESGYLYAFVEIMDWYNDCFACNVSFCEATNLPPVRSFIVPTKRRNYKSFVRRIKEFFPMAHISYKKDVSGSLTPYFLVFKISDFMLNPSLFFGSSKSELSSPVIFGPDYTRLGFSERTSRLPVDRCFDYMYINNLTIDKLWTTIDDDGKPRTHVTLKPR